MVDSDSLLRCVLFLVVGSGLACMEAQYLEKVIIVMETNKPFTLRTLPIDGTSKFSAIITWADGTVNVVQGQWNTKTGAKFAGLRRAGQIIDRKMRLGERG